MTNKKFYKLLDNLGMVDDTDDLDKAAKKFSNNTAKSYLKTARFVNDLCVNNDLETIEQLLIAIILKQTNEK